MVTHSTDTEEHCPIHLPPKCLTITKQDVKKAEVQEILNQGVPELCQRRWVSPVVVLTKKAGLARSCMECHKVNNVTRKDPYLWPRIDTLDALS